jgi:hypothetical protein
VPRASVGGIGANQVLWQGYLCCFNCESVCHVPRIDSRNIHCLSADDAVEVLQVNVFEEGANAREAPSTMSGCVMQVERGLVGILFMHDIRARSSLARFQKRVQKAIRLVQAHFVAEFSEQHLELTFVPLYDGQYIYPPTMFSQMMLYSPVLSIR